MVSKALLELAASISPKTIQGALVKNQVSLADQNEEKYAHVYEGPERLDTISDRYKAINSGFDNGTCATRRGTYKSFKRNQKTR